MMAKCYRLDGIVTLVDAACGLANPRARSFLTESGFRLGA